MISIVDDVPTAHNDSGTQSAENAPVTVNVIANDVPGADSVSLTTGVALVAGSSTGTGTPVYNNDGTFTYTPGAGEQGTVTFQYRITDGDGDTSVATVTITLLADSTPTVGITGDQSVDEAGLPARGSDPRVRARPRLRRSTTTPARRRSATSTSRPAATRLRA